MRGGQAPAQRSQRLALLLCSSNCRSRCSRRAALLQPQRVDSSGPLLLLFHQQLLALLLLLHHLLLTLLLLLHHLLLALLLLLSQQLLLLRRHSELLAVLLHGESTLLLRQLLALLLHKQCAEHLLLLHVEGGQQALGGKCLGGSPRGTRCRP